MAWIVVAAAAVSGLRVSSGRGEPRSIGCPDAAYREHRARIDSITRQTKRQAFAGAVLLVGLVVSVSVGIARLLGDL